MAASVIEFDGALSCTKSEGLILMEEQRTPWWTIFCTHYKNIGVVLQIFSKLPLVHGQRGKQPGRLKPFDKLKIRELPVELNARGIYTQDRTKEELEDNLKSILKGVHMYPCTLLLLNPTASLSDLNLEQYTIIDCEPLQDLKGHLIHLTKEIPFLLQSDTIKE